MLLKLAWLVKVYSSHKPCGTAVSNKACGTDESDKPCGTTYGIAPNSVLQSILFIYTKSNHIMLSQFERLQYTIYNMEYNVWIPLFALGISWNLACGPRLEYTYYL